MTKLQVIKLFTSSTVTLYIAFALRLAAIHFQTYPVISTTGPHLNIISPAYIAATILFLLALVRNPIEYALKRERFTLIEDWSVGYLATIIVAASYDGGNLKEGIMIAFFMALITFNKEWKGIRIIAYATIPISLLMLWLYNTPNLFSM